MIYKIEQAGLFRKVTAKLDSSFAEIIKRSEGRKFTIPILENKAKKKIDIEFAKNDTEPCTAIFNVHKAVDIQFIEQLISICEDVLREIKGKEIV
jgi:hypothetical protein